MNRSKLWEQLQQVHDEFRQGTFDTQDAVVTALHDHLERFPEHLFPSVFYPLIAQAFTHYCAVILPSRGMARELRQLVHQDFERTLQRLCQHEAESLNFELQLSHIFFQLKQGDLLSLKELNAALEPILGVSEFEDSHKLEKRYHTLRNAFTAESAKRFFIPFLRMGYSNSRHRQFQKIQELFWDQLDEQLHVKTVLLNTRTGKTRIIRFTIETSLLSQKQPDLCSIDNIADEKMLCSCRNAVHAAKLFLQENFPEQLKEHSLHVRCRFLLPTAQYTDTSASLAVALKVIGDVLHLAIDPQILISGEIDAGGCIHPVKHISEKITAAEQHPDIHHLYLPASVELPKSSQISILGIETLADAVKHYYGKQIQKQNHPRLFSRRNALKLFLGAFVFRTGGLSVRNLLSNPVTEHDWQLLECAGELYQKKSDYQSATTILKALLDRLSRYNSTEATQLKAYALGAKGIISLQQQQFQQSLSAFQKAFSLWKSLHDIENQADILLRIGELYRYLVITKGENFRDATKGIRYYEQAIEFLSPSMKHFTRLQGKCYTSLGYMYYWLDEPQMAEDYAERGVKCFDEPETNWSYQTARQHLGRILIKNGKYEKAYELLQETSQSSVLQAPYYRREVIGASGTCIFLWDNMKQALNVLAKRFDSVNSSIYMDNKAY